MRWTRSFVIMFLAIITVVFYLLAWVFPDPELLIFMRSLQMVSSGAVVIRYWPAARIAWKQNFLNEQQVYAFCMTLLSLAICLNAVWLYVWRSADEPRLMIDSALVNGYFVCLTYIAYTGKIIAPDAHKGLVDKRAYRWVFTVLALSVGFGIFGLWGHVFFVWLASEITPHLNDEPPRIPWIQK